MSSDATRRDAARPASQRQETASATRRGLLIVLSAPSGAGKSTLIRALRERNPLMDFSVSTTTRPPRVNERDGVDYHFTDEATFLRMIEAGEFIEHAEVHAHRYGTTRRTIERSLTAGRDLFLDIDVQGAAQIRAALPTARTALPAIFIFVAPPSIEVLEERLRRRGTDSEETILRRLRNAEKEMTRMDEYDHVVVNDTVAAATARIEAIIAAARDAAIRNATARLGRYQSERSSLESGASPQVTPPPGGNTAREEPSIEQKMVAGGAVAGNPAR